MLVECSREAPRGGRRADDSEGGGAGAKLALARVEALDQERQREEQAKQALERVCAPVLLAAALLHACTCFTPARLKRSRMRKRCAQCGPRLLCAARGVDAATASEWVQATPVLHYAATSAPSALCRQWCAAMGRCGLLRDDLLCAAARVLAHMTHNRRPRSSAQRAATAA